MKINEFASAADTLALWRVISDNTWAAVAQQAEAEAKQKAERAAARKSASKRGSSKSKPPKRLPPPLQHVSAPVAKADEKTSPATKQQAHTAQPPSAQQVKQSQATTASSQQPSALPLQQKALDMSKSHPKYSQPPSQPYSTSNEPKQ